jgi:hypothetical protein
MKALELKWEQKTLNKAVVYIAIAGRFEFTIIQDHLSRRYFATVIFNIPDYPGEENFSVEIGKFKYIKNAQAECLKYLQRIVGPFILEEDNDEEFYLPCGYTH